MKNAKIKKPITSLGGVASAVVLSGEFRKAFDDLFPCRPLSMKAAKSVLALMKQDNKFCKAIYDETNRALQATAEALDARTDEALTKAQLEIGGQFFTVAACYLVIGAVLGVARQANMADEKAVANA